MVPTRRISLFAFFAMASMSAGLLVGEEATAWNKLATTREAPLGSGYTVTTVPAVTFYPEGFYAYFTSGSMGRFSIANVVTNYFAGLDLPPGAVIDYIGLNSTTNVPSIIGAEIIEREKTGDLHVIGGIDSVPHDVWDTDFNASPIGYTWRGHSGVALILHVQFGSDPNPQFFGWVEVWWKRAVSPPPEEATFSDVPTNHPFFQYIEALAASGITAGCDVDKFCPGAPITRGQMAVFLTKALGLFWPN